MQSQGLLFVWPDENGLERARATKPPKSLIHFIYTVPL
jgi:phenylpropionate dioxygenase-like ring-hydroxylating dioxygenase large terminal subunit